MKLLYNQPQPEPQLILTTSCRVTKVSDGTRYEYNINQDSNLQDWDLDQDTKSQDQDSENTVSRPS